tara:strand:+ start:68 stop:538 length:471 start_codon:yes stop_codon:yes gene_type:complete
MSQACYIASLALLDLCGVDFPKKPEYTYEDIQFPDGYTKPSKEVFEAKLREIVRERNWKNLREERNTRLAEVDWVFSGDYRVDIEMYQEWLLYRKALRDLPSTTEDPANPIWPKKPATANGKTVDYYERDTQSTKIILLQNVVNSLMKRIENLENP